MAERTLTQRDLNRALLARQLLLERVRLPIPKALERMGGIQNQYAPNGYIRLHSCLEEFRRDDLTRALERRTVVQATLMRGTIHLVSRSDFWPLAVAVRGAQRDWWLQVHRPRPSVSKLEQAAERVRVLLEGGPRTHAEVAEIWKAAGGWGPWLELVRVPPSGTWERRRAHLFDSAENWIGPETVSVDDALDLVVRRYLGAFGPAPVDDISRWAKIGAQDLAPALERVRLRRFRDENGNVLLDVPRAPLPDPATPAPVRFLPTWDAILLVHTRRTGVLPEEYRPVIFSTKTPHSVGTFLVDGSVAGTWRFEQGRVETTPLRRLDRGTLREVRDEGERLAGLYA